MHTLLLACPSIRSQKHWIHGPSRAQGRERKLRVVTHAANKLLCIVGDGCLRNSNTRATTSAMVLVKTWCNARGSGGSAGCKSIYLAH